MSATVLVASTLVSLPALSAGDTSPASLLNDWRAEAGLEAPFSADRGKQLFQQKGKDWNCSTCHTADPRGAGKHAMTGKPILALAPSANPQRFTDRAKVDKWFRRNCRDVLGRECTPTEKGDLLTWLLSVR
jgi:mono/diheme cytochrome c family protein